MNNSDLNKKGNSSTAILCDFDNTAVIENVGELLLEHFGLDGWREFQRSHRANAISLQEYQERAFSVIMAPKESMQKVVKHLVTLRKHFRSLSGFCSQNNLTLAIVSMGLDFYIDAVLDREGLKSIPVYSVNTKFTKLGITFDYHFRDSNCYQPGNCKCRVLQSYREVGNKIIYIGDGLSDICPALKSDTVFATGILEKYLNENAIPYVPLNDFSEVVDFLANDIKITQGECYH